MITGDPTAYNTPAELGDAIGFWSMVGIVVVCLLLGAWSLIQRRDRHKVGDSFADDFIPDRATIATTEKTLPKMPGQR